MKLTPLQTMKKNFETRTALVDKLVATADKQHGDQTDAQLKSRLMGLSSRKLLRLYRVEQKVREQFGDKAKLIAHIVDARKKAGLTADEAYVERIRTFSKGQLLDMTHQNFAPPAEKRSPAMKLQMKRGKKQRARALAKAGAA